MKILEATIEHFGQFHHWSLEFADAPFLTIFGPNEAGKSTLVAFIKCIFFGFPRKNELEPYIGGIDHKSDLGGSVTIRVADFGKVKIVRHYGRAGGAATLLLENGDVMGESELSEWFMGVSRELYDAIFCFDLDGLKGIESLKPNELNRFLFSTGMMGNAELFEMEKALEKESGNLFKTGGRNPVINQTVSELKTIQGKISTWEKQMDDYMALKAEAANLLEKIEEAKTNRRHVEEEKREYQRYIALESLLIDYQRIQSDIESLPDTTHFPEDGKERFDHWKTHIVSLQAEQADAEKKITAVKSALIECREDVPILLYERNVLALQRESAERATRERGLAKTSEQIKTEQANLHMGLSQLNMNESDLDSIKAMRVTLSTKQTLKSWMTKWQSVQQERSAFEITVQEASHKLQLLKEKLQQLNRREMSEARFIELEQVVKNHDPIHLEQERARLVQDSSALKRSREMAGLLSRLKMGLTGGIVVLFIIFAVVLFQTMTLIVGIGVTAIGLIFAALAWFVLKGFETRFKPEMDELNIKKRKQELDALLLTDVSGSTYLYDQEKSRREQMAVLSTQLDDEKRTYQTYIQRLEQLNMKVIDIETGINEWRRNLGLPDGEILILPDVYQLIEKVREEVLHLERLRSEAHEYHEFIKEYDEKLEFLATQLNAPGLDLYEMGIRLDKAKTEKEKKDKLNESLSLLQENEQSLSRKVARYKDVCQDLLDQAGVDSDEAFYHLSHILEQKSAMEDSLEALFRQLCHLAPQEETRQTYFSWASEGKWVGHNEEDYTRRVDAIDHEIGEMRKRWSECATNIEHMEKDDTYAELIHDFKEKSYFLQEQAKKWGTIHLALSLLREAKENYRETRLPKVLALASNYLSQFTNQSYVKVYYTEPEGFTLEKTDGTLFGAGELSRGTGEQLYLSLRLALIKIYKTKESLPIIIDDGFVNFDAGRRHQVLDVLKKVADDRQILLFTCHRYHTEDIFELGNTNLGVNEHVGPIVSDSAR